MVSIKIKENSDLELEPELRDACEKMLEDDNSMPLHIKGNTLCFDKYTIGSLKIGDYNIEIEPRNPVFTLETVFEMLLYESLNNFDENYLSSGFGDNQSFGISSITSQFYYECVRLIDFGLTGGFISEARCGKEVNGRLLMDRYHPAYLPVKGVEYMCDRYSVNVTANQVIKSAILKVLKMETRKNVRRDYQQLLKSFSMVDEYNGSLYTLDYVSNRFFSANPHYPITLEFAIKILRDMKMKFTHGSVSWNAFLHNSNDIYEKYVRKVVAKGLDAYVSKWDMPKQIAVLDDGIRKGNKGYIPDILIDYNSLDGSAKAVLDAKNKVFETDKDNIGEILHSADMYQLAFYCDKLKTNLGGLIYPAGSDFRPIQVMIDGSTDFRFVLFSINMREKISIRHRKLCEAIENELLFYMR